MQPVQLHKEGSQQYLFFPLDDIPKQGYINQLFQYHSVPGFLNYELRSINEQTYIYYRLRCKTSLEFLRNHLSFNEKMIDGMIRSVMDIIKVCHEYLLSYENIIWSTEYIFMDMETGNLEFCYSPVETEHNNICSFLSELMQFVGKKNEESMVALLQLYDYVTEPGLWETDSESVQQKKAGAFDMISEPEEAEGKRELENDGFHEESVHTKNVPNRRNKIFFCITGMIIIVILFMLLCFVPIVDRKYYPVVIPAFIFSMVFLIMGITGKKNESDKGEPSLEDYFEKKEEDEKLQERENRVVSESKETIYGETTILKEESQENSRIFVEDCPRQLSLFPRQEGQYPVMEIQSHSIIIGCMKENCDYVLSKRGISRIHAKLIMVEKLIYILDLNSTNGTYLNGERLECGKDYLLKKGDIVAFSNIEFLVDEKKEEKEMY